MSDAELIARILSGEEQLFARLVDRYSGYVWALCSGYIRNPSDCEDVAQEVFVQCYRRLDTLRNPAAFGRWLGQVTRRQCLMWLRTSARREERLAKYSDEVDAGHMRTASMAAESAGREQLHQGIRDAIDTLPEDYREALFLRYAEGYSVRDAASFLGITPAAIRKRLERGQRMLKERLWEEVEPALGKRKHKEDFTRGVVAAIPLGSAPWLGTAGSGAVAGATALTKLSTIGGIAVMSKKAAIGIIALVLALVVSYPLVRGLRGRGVDVHPPTAPSTGETPAPVAENVPEDPSVTQPPLPAPVPITEEEGPAPDDSRPISAQAASVSGYVRDGEAYPFADADVVLEIGRDGNRNDVVKTYRARTGADGKYTITNIAEFGSAFGFASAESCVMQRRRAKIAPGQNLEGLDFTLERAGSYIAGRVVTQSGMPIPGASVDILYYGYDEAGLAHTAATGQTTGNIGGAKFLFAVTDSNGRFAIGLNIPVDALCDFRVTKQGYGPGFFPQIPASTHDAVFVLRSGGAIAGRVSTTQGEPVEGATVRVQGEALPGGLARSSVRIQTLPTAPIVVMSAADGSYLAEGLGEDYTYSVTVPAPGEAEREELPEEQGLRHIAGKMRGFDQMMFGGEAFAARKEGIRVTEGRTTSGVDLVLGSPNYATVRGTVTDRASGKPVCPVVVTAGAIDPEAAISDEGVRRPWYKAALGASAVTNLDGAYVLQIRDLRETVSFRIGYEFMTKGGSSWDQPDEEMAKLELGPGVERELDFTVDGPVTVPVRYVDQNGAPLEGILAAMRRAGARYGCGGALISGADGRVTFHGIPPFAQLEAVAWQRVEEDVRTIGASAPFSGRPGETFQEVVVTCRLLGGIEGSLIHAEGRPAADVEFTCEAQPVDAAAGVFRGEGTTDRAGRFCMLEYLPEGLYQTIRLSYWNDQSAGLYFRSVDNVAVVAGAVTNLGALTVEAETDWMRILEASNYGRKANEAIGEIYSTEWLDELSGPFPFLKTGFALYDSGKYQEALEVFDRMALRTGEEQDYLAIALIWQGHMLDLLGRRQDAVAVYGDAAALDVDDRIRHDQFGMVYSPSEYARHRTQVPFTRIENLLE